MAWVARYEAAWRSGDRTAVCDLFSGDAHYLRSPYADALVGHAAIGDFWVDDEGAQFTMSAERVAIEGAVAVVRVVVRYDPPTGQEYTDLWLLRFSGDGRVEHFEEWAYWPDKPYTANPD